MYQANLLYFTVLLNYFDIVRDVKQFLLLFYIWGIIHEWRHATWILLVSLTPVILNPGCMTSFINVPLVH